jgi:hypothetical protein
MTATISGDGTSTLINLTTSGNTVLGDASTDTLNVGNGGLVKDASGNVGIGTSSPAFIYTDDTTLTVNGKQSATSYRSALELGNNGSLGAIYFCSTANAVLGSYANIPLAFRTNNTERMRIDTSGRVGVGTTNPTAKQQITSTSAGAATVGLFLNNVSDTTSTEIRLAFAASSNDDIATNRYSYISLLNTAGNNSGTLVFATNASGASATERMRIDSSGGLILAGSTAQKATGTTWSNPSDQRLKDNIRDYTKGTTELMKVRVREWEYNGKGGTTEGMKGLGVIADEVMTVLPDTIENYDAKLNADDEETTAIKKFDATEITWLLVKTVQEQQALITTLTDRITALEAKG